MKVLFLLSNYRPFKYPADVVLGGMEMVELQQLKAMRELDYDVTLAYSEDSSSEGYEFVKLPTKCSVSGAYRLSKVIDVIDEIADDFDVIFTNKNINVSPQSSRFDKLRRWAPKLRTINHIDDSYPSSWVGINNLLACKELVTLGLRHAHVSPKAHETWEGIASKIMEGRAFATEPFFKEHLTKFQNPSSTDHYEVMVTSEDFPPIDSIVGGDSILFAARPCPLKGGHVLAKALVKLGWLDRGEFFCSPPGPQKEHENLAEIQEIVPEVKLGRPHSELMDAYCWSMVYVLPTKLETAGGITTFEAAACGVPVVTSSVWSDRYLKPYGLLFPLEKRTPNQLAKVLQENQPAFKALTTERRREIAKRVREDYSWGSYKKQLSEFLQK